MKSLTLATKTAAKPHSLTFRRNIVIIALCTLGAGITFVSFLVAVSRLGKEAAWPSILNLCIPKFASTLVHGRVAIIASHLSFMPRCTIPLSVSKTPIESTFRGSDTFLVPHGDANLSLLWFEFLPLTHLVWADLKQRPFKCEQCGTKFGQRSSLTRHVRTLHEWADYGEQRLVYNMR